MNAFRPNGLHLLITALTVLLSPHLHAVPAPDETETDDSVQRLKTLEVTAARRPLATVQSISGPELQAISSTSIADALKYMAGVQIKDYGGLGGMKTVNVRSLGAQHVGVYIDGVRITNAQNGTVDLGKYSLSTLESVSLYNANRLGDCQSASEYASGATVYMQTRRPQNDSLTVMASAGSFDTYKGRVNAQFCRRGWSGFIDGEYVNSRGDYPFRYKSEYEDTIGRRRNSDIRYWRAEAAAFHNGFSSHFYYYNSERGCPGGIVRRLSDKYTNIGREWDTDLFAQASWHHDFSPMHSVKFNARYSYEYLRYNTDYPANQNTARVDNHYWMNDAYLSAAYSLRPLQWLAANVSYDARMTWLDADLKRFNAVRRFDQKAVAALELSHRGLRLAGSMLYQHYRDFTDMKAGAVEPISRFTPAVTLAYSYGNLQLRAWYKKIFRVPTLNDLYYTQSGNRNLKPEYTRQFDFGAEYSWFGGPWSAQIQADAYINHIDNRIVCLPMKGTYNWSMMNYGKTYCRGLNATVQGRYATSPWHVSLLGTITWQRDLNRTDKEDIDTYNKPICYSPTLSTGVTAIIGWRWLTLTVSDLHVGKRMWSYADPDDQLKPYNNVDLKITGVWCMLTASLEINDLFDVQYEHIPRYPMPGRNFMGSISVTL